MQVSQEVLRHRNAPMRSIPVHQASGMVLCHDITRIVPGEGKGPAFRKGHVVEDGDIETLLKLGKEHLYVWDLADGFIHEDDAAERRVQELHQAIEDVTGIRPPGPPAKPRIGFLP